jgi:hypothetical protein
MVFSSSRFAIVQVDICLSLSAVTCFVHLVLTIHHLGGSCARFLVILEQFLAYWFQQAYQDHHTVN